MAFTIDNGSVNLRTLTRKSLFGFGLMRDLTVQQGIDTGRVREILKMYYFLSKINFIEEVLLEIGITEELRIPKPSNIRGDKKAYPMIKKAMDNYYSKFTSNQRMGFSNRGKKSRAREVGKKENKQLESNGFMQARNHGKKPSFKNEL